MALYTHALSSAKRGGQNLFVRIPVLDADLINGIIKIDFHLVKNDAE